MRPRQSRTSSHEGRTDSDIHASSSEQNIIRGPRFGAIRKCKSAMKMGLKYVVSAGSETKTSVRLRWARRTTKAQREEPQPQSDLPESPSPDHHVSRKENTRIVRVQGGMKCSPTTAAARFWCQVRVRAAHLELEYCNLLFMLLSHVLVLSHFLTLHVILYRQSAVSMKEATGGQ